VKFRRWKLLQNIPAAIKFISFEPALGSLRLPKVGPLPDWLTTGGESGGGARPLKPRWIRNIIEECRDRGVAVSHKQWGNCQNNPLVREQGMSAKDVSAIDHFGKCGSLVDGLLVREFPQQAEFR
jgi:protein gp37